MAGRTLTPVPLTRERFAPYGDVIDASGRQARAMNDARFDRVNDLCNIDVGDGRVAVGITTSRVATSLPYLVGMVERHPLGSQAFVPLSPCRMIVVVAPPGESVSAGDLVAFETNGRQGVNYARGTWHMPLIAFTAGQRYLIIDRAPDRPNCDEVEFDEPVRLVGA
ncbi:MAG: ureidoglycolate lyase [Woeseiaceae bacterium]|nr:ureidoglycolate lyase [Woeseiaceae bacterium]